MLAHQPQRHFKSTVLVLTVLLSSWFDASAFAPNSAISSRHDQTRRNPIRPLLALDNDYNADAASSTGDNISFGADSITRRRLVFSLLAGSSILPASALAAANGEISAASSTSLTISTTSSAEERVIRPPLDKRQYEVYTLPNGLKVLLCSDPTSTAAAVGMNVHVGACSDPVEIPGLVSTVRYLHPLSTCQLLFITHIKFVFVYFYQGALL